MQTELDQRYSALEDLQKSGNAYDRQEVEKELDALEKLQFKYNKVEARRKKNAKQNYEQVREQTARVERLRSVLDIEICRCVRNWSECIEK